jgi:hypothetical protein
MPRCSYCRGKGYVKDPFLRANNDCPECGGSGWIEPDVVEVFEVIEEEIEDPKITEARRKRQHEFDRYMILKI